MTGTSNGNIYIHDQNSNQTSRRVGGTTYTLIYNAENRLVQVKLGRTIQATYTYDGDGNRVKTVVGSTTTAFVGNILEWTGSTTMMKKYYYAGGQRVAMRQGSSTLYYLLTDHLGSTSITATSGGGFYTELRYYPWGGTRYASGTTPTSFRYTGQREAEVGLYYYGARFYDPQLGRFVQPDTDVPESQGVQAWDRYAGMNNNPVKYTDPSGHMISECGPSDCTGVTEQELQENAQREAILLAESQQYQCAAGNTEYCSYAVAHPVETAVFVTGGLVTAGAAGPVIDAIGVAAGGITASATTAVEVSTGANVVYRLLENGTTRYVGITNDFFRRAGEHLERGWSITPIQGLENLSRIDARAVEQTLIEYYGLGNLYNSINSIAASNPIYQQAIQRGTEILQTIGFFGK